MHIQHIKQIANGNLKLYKSLIYGYLRSCSCKEFFDLILQYTYEPKLGYWVFNCFSRQKNSEYTIQLSEHFLSELSSIKDYKKCITIGRYLNYLYDNSSEALQEKIAIALLASKKKPLRIYACKKRLDMLPNNMPFTALSMFENKHDEMSAIIDTITREYHDDFIELNFSILIAQKGIKEYQIRKLFSRMKNPHPDHLKWLENNFPTTALYVAFIHDHNITDDKALELSNNTLKTVNQNSYESEDLYSFIYWCLARLRKWDVIKEIVANREKNHG